MISGMTRNSTRGQGETKTSRESFESDFMGSGTFLNGFADLNF
jgi:hypothetical protein